MSAGQQAAAAVHQAMVVQQGSLLYDNFEATDVAPSIVFVGPPGTGKSFEMSRAYPNAYYIQTQKDLLRFAADYSRKYPKNFPYVPKHITLDEQIVGQLWQGSFYSALMYYMDLIVKLCDAGQFPHSAVIFDEWTTLCLRVYLEMMNWPSNRSGSKLNAFALYECFDQFHSLMLSFPRRVSRAFGFVCHPDYAVYFEDKDDPKFGQLKFPGGPWMPKGCKAQRIKLGQEASAVIEMNVKQPERKKPGLSTLAIPPPGAAAAMPQPGQPASAQPQGQSSLAGLAALKGPATAPAQTPAPAPVSSSAKEDVSDVAELEASKKLMTVSDSTLPRVLLTQTSDDFFRKIRGADIPSQVMVTLGTYGLRELLAQANYPADAFRVG